VGRRRKRRKERVIELRRKKRVIELKDMTR